MAWTLKGSWTRRRARWEPMRPRDPSASIMRDGHHLCQAMLAFDIRGQTGIFRGDSTLKGPNAVVIIDTPKVMVTTYGNTRMGMFYHERVKAPSRPTSWLKAFGGRRPAVRKEGLAPTKGQGARRRRGAHLELTDDGPRDCVRVGDAIDFEIEEHRAFGR